MNALENIVNWNEERGLIQNGFNHKKEVSFIIEELLESTGAHDSVSAREEAQMYAEKIVGSSSPTDEEVVDAFADIIVFATGAIAKKGYDPTKVMEEVCKEINSRTGKLVDGKFVKDKDAVLYQANLAACKCR